MREHEVVLACRAAQLPEQDDFNKIPELQVCIAEALYDVDSIVADPGACTKDLQPRAGWEITGSGEDELASMMLQISEVVAREFTADE